MAVDSGGDAAIGSWKDKYEAQKKKVSESKPDDMTKEAALGVPFVHHDVIAESALDKSSGYLFYRHPHWKPLREHGDHYASSTEAAKALAGNHVPKKFDWKDYNDEPVDEDTVSANEADEPEFRQRIFRVVKNAKDRLKDGEEHNLLIQVVAAKAGEAAGDILVYLDRDDLPAGHGVVMKQHTAIAAIDRDMTDSDIREEIKSVMSQLSRAGWKAEADEGKEEDRWGTHGADCRGSRQGTSILTPP